MFTIKCSQDLTNTEAVIVFYTKDNNLSYHHSNIDSLFNKFRETKALSDDKYCVLSSYIAIDNYITCIIFVGLGDIEKCTNKIIQRASYLGVKESLKYKINSISICLFENITSSQQQKVVEGALFANYNFDKYHLEQKEKKEFTIELVKTGDLDKKAIEIGKITALNIFEARNIVNEPANNMTPIDLAEYVLQNQNKGYTAEIFDENKIKEFKMNAFYAVAQGSCNPPKLIVMKYNGCPENKEVIGLIGKGLTYDSGGYSLKPSNGMKTMKADMGGAGSVIAAMSTLAQIKASVNVVAIVPACENLISDRAYKPGDIIQSMSGKYIEVDNADAEGRLTIIDAITYAICEHNVTTIIDVATLTGGAVVAFGKEYNITMTNNERLWDLVSQSSDISGDKVWRLPIDENLGKENKSKIADLKNSAGCAGTITAGMFIGEFVEEKPWVHFDIAGPAYVDDDNIFCGSGATGVPTSLLCELIQKYFNVSSI